MGQTDTNIIDPPNHVFSHHNILAHDSKAHYYNLFPRYNDKITLKTP